MLTKSSFVKCIGHATAKMLLMEIVRKRLVALSFLPWSVFCKPVAFCFDLFFRTVSEWVNPGQYGLVVVTSSEGRNLPYGKLEDILTRDSTAHNCHTNDDK